MAKMGKRRTTALVILKYHDQKLQKKSSQVRERVGPLNSCHDPLITFVHESSFVDVKCQSHSDRIFHKTTQHIVSRAHHTRTRRPSTRRDCSPRSRGFRPSTQSLPLLDATSDRICRHFPSFAPPPLSRRSQRLVRRRPTHAWPHCLWRKNKFFFLFLRIFFFFFFFSFYVLVRLRVVV
jgi:hypothetical protein